MRLEASTFLNLLAHITNYWRRDDAICKSVIDNNVDFDIFISGCYETAYVLCIFY